MLVNAAVAALPVLTLLLIMGGVAKLFTAGDDGGGQDALSRLGPAVLVPERFRRTAMLVCAIGEFALVAGQLAADLAVARWLTVVFFAISTYVLWDLRRRRPDVGCGCFGEVSSTPVGLRSVTRTAVLTGMAVAVAVSDIGAADALAGVSWTAAAWAAGYLALLLSLSPEVEEIFSRLRHRAPCEERPMPADRALTRLRSSTAWRAHAAGLESDEPYDSWRELCWRFFVFPGQGGADVVFAVYLSGRRPAVRVAVVGQDGNPIEPLQESIAVSA
ncbi:MauE/DoxX family redox-associated membrane protein [Microtetraspora niveoalba]|uniref:MauE/DoxX family redox-associated membrane protein n=1 Tax=Microtetraspora niveoalba TaxID=46175 RepID=UPI0008350E69|nr:MauE/DoxX family redox-associated membrane protein [Microtetraspora niveoalba]